MCEFSVRSFFWCLTPGKRAHRKFAHANPDFDSLTPSKSFEVYFKRQKVGLYKADIVVENLVVVELKCCKSLLPEHQAQVINYLAASNLPVGLLVNFNNKQLDF